MSQASLSGQPGKGPDCGRHGYAAEGAEPRQRLDDQSALRSYLKSWEFGRLSGTALLGRVAAGQAGNAEQEILLVADLRDRIAVMRDDW